MEKVPAFPESVRRLLSLTSSLEYDPKDLVQVIRYDPVLTLKILKLVNSAYFGLSKPIATIHHAVVFLGVNTIKNLALSAATVGVLPGSRAAGFRSHAFWRHSLAVAVASKRIAREMGVGRIESEDYFVAGLLHDVGKTVLACFFQKEFELSLQEAAKRNSPLHVQEREVFGLCHADIGGMLGEKWQLPARLDGSIRGHHGPFQSQGASEMSCCVFLADLACRVLHIGSAGNPVLDAVPDTLYDRVGMDLEQAVDLLKDLGEEMDKARIFMTL